MLNGKPAFTPVGIETILRGNDDMIQHVDAQYFRRHAPVVSNLIVLRA